MINKFINNKVNFEVLKGGKINFMLSSINENFPSNGYRHKSVSKTPINIETISKLKSRSEYLNVLYTSKEIQKKNAKKDFGYEIIRGTKKEFQNFSKKNSCTPFNKHSYNGSIGKGIFHKTNLNSIISVGQKRKNFSDRKYYEKGQQS